MKSARVVSRVSRLKIDVLGTSSDDGDGVGPRNVDF
jgi:hypothetical protein